MHRLTTAYRPPVSPSFRRPLTEREALLERIRRTTEPESIERELLNFMRSKDGRVNKQRVQSVERLCKHAEDLTRAFTARQLESDIGRGNPAQLHLPPLITQPVTRYLEQCKPSVQQSRPGITPPTQRRFVRNLEWTLKGDITISSLAKILASLNARGVDITKPPLHFYVR